jgi:glycosyltransferase domain-containing protein
MTTNQLSKLTLVIATFKRQLFAIRNMSYWSGTGVTVYVIDGSPDAISAEKLVEFSTNIHYIHLPISLFDRIKYSIDLIKTDYCAFLGDDEFYLPSALASCIGELDSQPDLVSCIGQCIGFDFTSNRVIGYSEYPLMNEYKVMQDNPIERMVAHMDPYVPSTIYSVVRTEVWKKTVKIISEKEHPAFAIGELQFELAVCYQGKSKVIKELMWLRSNESPGIRGTDESLKPEKTFIGWWRNSENSEERAGFLKIMGAGLATSEDQVNGISLGVKKALDVYVASRLNMSTFAEWLKNEISKLLPQFLISTLKKIIRTMRNIFSNSSQAASNLKEEHLLHDMAVILANTGVKVDDNELSNIEHIILNFHANKHNLV